MSQQRHEWVDKHGRKHWVREEDGFVGLDFAGGPMSAGREILRLASEVETLKEERDEAMAMLEERIYLALKGGGNSLHLGRFNRLRARISGRELEATLLAAREQPAEPTKGGEMTAFRKRPVVIEAQRFDGTQEECGRLARWCNGATRLVGGNSKTKSPRRYVVSIGTLEGNMRAEPGDWIIRGVKGEFYPCKPDIFEATYEPAEPGPAPLADAEGR